MANTRDLNLDQIRQELVEIPEKIYRLPDSNSLGSRDAGTYYRLQKTLEQNGFGSIVREVKKEVMKHCREDVTFTLKLAFTNRDNLKTACDMLRTYEDQSKKRKSATAPLPTRQLPPASVRGGFLTPPARYKQPSTTARSQNDARMSAVAAAAAAAAAATAASSRTELPMQTSSAELPKQSESSNHAAPPDLSQAKTVSLTGAPGLFQSADNNTNNDGDIYGTGCSCVLM